MKIQSLFLAVFILLATLFSGSFAGEVSGYDSQFLVGTDQPNMPVLNPVLPDLNKISVHTLNIICRATIIRSVYLQASGHDLVKAKFYTLQANEARSLIRLHSFVYT